MNDSSEDKSERNITELLNNADCDFDKIYYTLGFIFDNLNDLKLLEQHNLKDILKDSFTAYKILSVLSDNTKNQIHIELLKSVVEDNGISKEDYKKIRKCGMLRTKMSEEYNLL